MVRKLTLALLAVCVMLSGALVVFSQPAHAAGEFALDASFGKEGSGNGEFNGPINVSVQQSNGDVFVVDNGNQRVQVFDSSGNYLTQIDGAEAPGGFEGILGVAVDNGVSNGDVYVAVRNSNFVDKFKPKGSAPGEGYEYLCQFSGVGEGCVSSGGVPNEPFVEPSTVAIDANGNLYVAGREGSVLEFDAEGNYVAKLGSTIYSASSIAVNASGSAVYVASFPGELFKLTVEPVSHIVLDEVMLATEGVTSVAVDPESSDVFVDHGSGGVSKYQEEATGKAGEEPLEMFGDKGEIGGPSFGIAYSTSNRHVYVTDLVNGNIRVFAPAVSGLRPEVTCLAPKELKAKSAVLVCTIIPQGGDPEAQWNMEYREAGSSIWNKTQGGEIASAGEVEETITELKPETKYVYRAVASNIHGNMTSARIGFVTTGVIAVGECTASNITEDEATLAASVEPSLLVEYYFEYGRTIAYGSSTKVEELQPGNKIVVHAAVDELEPNAAYDCRLVASDVEGTSPGKNGEFKTLEIPPSVNDQAPTASAMTRTSAILNGTINPNNSPTTYYFAYISDTSYQTAFRAHAVDPYSAGRVTKSSIAGSGFGDVAVKSPRIEGLRAGTTYHYVLVASNGANQGNPEVGPDYMFTTAARTPPVVDVSKAGALTPTSATIAGTVDPKGLRTTYEVDLGTEIGGKIIYGARSVGQVVGVGEVITLTVEDLAPNVTYHYRILATNEDGTTEGTNEAFTTLGIPSLVVQPLTAPLLATPSIAFPTAAGRVIEPPKNKGIKVRRKHRKIHIKKTKKTIHKKK
jgi:hypothetical protein